MATAKAEDPRIAELEAQVADLRRIVQRSEPDKMPLTPNAANALVAKAARDAAYEARLAAPKTAYRYMGRRVRLLQHIANDALPRVIAERTLGGNTVLVDRGDELAFDPADDVSSNRKAKKYRRGQPIFLSKRDYDALTRSGYVFVATGSTQEKEVDDLVGSALRAIENDSYEEACRVLRAENAMPHDENGNVVKTKAEVMTALGNWIDEQRKG